MRSLAADFGRSGELPEDCTFAAEVEAPPASTPSAEAPEPVTEAKPKRQRKATKKD